MKLRTFVLAATTLLPVAAYGQAVTVGAPLGAAGGAATGPVTLDTPYQIHYFSNLTAGDSYVNIVNDGARGSVGTGAAATAATVNTGTLCANVYVFAADEEFVSCCSCPVTPDGLVSLSAQKDLIANTVQNTNLLGGATAIVVKLLATVPTGISFGSAGTCTGSAFLTPASTAVAAQIVLSNGMVAWGTNLHTNTSSGTTPSPYGLTETAFVPASIDTSFTASSELQRLGQLCSQYTATGVQGIGQGSGTGICASCRLGGLGAASSNQ
jgi:hypothetical protein